MSVSLSFLRFLFLFFPGLDLPPFVAGSFADASHGGGALELLVRRCERKPSPALQEGALRLPKKPNSGPSCCCRPVEELEQGQELEQVEELEQGASGGEPEGAEEAAAGEGMVPEGGLAEEGPPTEVPSALDAGLLEREASREASHAAREPGRPSARPLGN